MDEKKNKEGVSVKEIENFARKHRFEVFACLAFVLACIFGTAIYHSLWMVGGATAGAIVGVLLSTQIAALVKRAMTFVFKQETTTQLVLGIVLLIVAIFLSPLIFFAIGVHGGKNISTSAKEFGSK